MTFVAAATSGPGPEIARGLAAAHVSVATKRVAREALRRSLPASDAPFISGPVAPRADGRW